MKFLRDNIGSFWLTYLLLAIYAASCARATFIENDFGTEAAVALVYASFWFKALHIFLAINLIVVLIRFRVLERKRYSVFLLHFSFLVILVGAALTQNVGFEGRLHIREGESSSVMESRENYLIVQTLEGDVLGEHSIKKEEFPVRLASVGSQPFEFSIPLSKGNLSLRYKDFIPNEDLKSGQALVSLSYDNNQDDIALQQGVPSRFLLGDLKMAIMWGPKQIQLPFTIKLEDFELERYPGSHAPSSYSSRVIVEDTVNNVTMPYHIYMNHTLDYGGYRFFQESYDRDELGTYLSVNNDPGKIPTYIGYFLLTLAFIWILFDKKGRFCKLSTFVKSQNTMGMILVCILSLGVSAYATEEQNSTQAETQMLNDVVQKLVDLQNNTKEHSKIAGTLLVQDFGGRIEPLDTLASDLVHKITKKDGFLGLSNMQIYLSMVAYPEYWKGVKMIRITTPALRKILGLSPNDPYASFYDLYTSNGVYKLYNLVTDTNMKKPAERGTLDKDILAVNERFEAMFQILSSNSLRIFPDPNGTTQKWYAPIELEQLSEQDANYALGLVVQYFRSFDSLVVNGDEKAALDALKSLKAHQEHFGKDLIPSAMKVEAELLLNHSLIFVKLYYAYLLFGILLFVVSLARLLLKPSVCKQRWFSKKLDLILLTLISLILLLHTGALILRWYVSGHAPWSNAYESMIYVAWASALSGILLLRHSSLAFSASSMMAGIVLFVAHLSEMDPQISNLVPVLKSYWLNIHVSIITASYGFLALCFMLGIITLFLFLFRKEVPKDSPDYERHLRLDSSIQSLSAINEMSMIIGLAMLSIGTFLGGIWANESWGRYWGWDPKETWSLISMIVYAIILHIRFVKAGNTPYVFASFSVLGFYSILMTYFGVNYYLSGMHSYAAGDPVPVPVFLYYFVAATILLIVVAGWKGKLKSGV
ncbi:c-type cytochrome biogenesis protein CcsB [Helicobacter monodelphidis]|uniref:c-type cytochrome biogenesis protein CcsB n=1 Tax=Helicobacter sp. 15-1451 TaxID=2004995 RepID=UPI000DCBC3A3|nr:c-type cytochrome biogenesis protein CcsB [Helicobacter sp. 15-1451]RAX58353.1 c-type cytochrome biogenesis protein CcsB [Helicobacter sp. 15-1451]